MCDVKNSSIYRECWQLMQAANDGLPLTNRELRVVLFHNGGCMIKKVAPKTYTATVPNMGVASSAG